MPTFPWPIDVHPAARDPFVWGIINLATFQGLSPEKTWERLALALWEDRDRLLKILGEEKYRR